jgi:transcriptional regulator with XRE-family HTH domain
MKTPLQLARERSGLTQAEAAAHMGIDRTYYSRIETGKCKGHPYMAKKLVAFYGAPLTRDEVLFPEEYVGTPLPPHPQDGAQSEAA